MAQSKMQQSKLEQSKLEQSKLEQSKLQQKNKSSENQLKNKTVLDKVGFTEADPVIDKMKKKREYDMQLVSGVFTFDEIPGSTLTFYLRKYKGTGKHYSLVDGERYELPRFVAEHLAKSGGYPVHEYQTDAKGKAIAKIGRKRRRYSFHGVGFDNGSSSKLITVENVNSGDLII